MGQDLFCRVQRWQKADLFDLVFVPTVSDLKVGVLAPT